ncbi:hypothetical protein JMJ77_0007616 [Colletotrichum scovillei]|uniref:Uncharacterized protein n=1 Tax=Colletotrichum scovillei TaxID=1209932 RepID=A0A9P7ULB0_9PEZI|nr:hypothetical protein JMJ77_0007616 [Colletotrichum scovillei]KAG7074629.1 hypothetical protein JMJ76_0011104 [Colletotrichum scovillei]KAG7081531.1 hypothetical protein JMJ78_0003650 [Colletotrichum scovillei]
MAYAGPQEAICTFGQAPDPRPRPVDFPTIAKTDHRLSPPVRRTEGAIEPGPMLHFHVGSGPGNWSLRPTKSFPMPGLRGAVQSGSVDAEMVQRRA